MGIIFYFSAQPGTVSDKVSEAVMNSLQSSKANRFTPQWFSTTSLHANVRKWAHVYIYCALGVSMTATVHLWTRKISLWQQGLLPLRCVRCPVWGTSCTNILFRGVPCC